MLKLLKCDIKNLFILFLFDKIEDIMLTYTNA